MTLPPLPDLKPCPFCGSTNISTDDARDFVSCLDCYTEGPCNLGQGSTSNVEAWNRRAAIAAHAGIAAVPAQPGIRTLSSEQIERHTLTASECPHDSAVMLVSSINRLLSKRPGDAARFAQPVAWLCSLMMEDGTTRTQIVEQDPAGLRWNDDGEPSPYKVQPLYAAPQAVPAPAGWSVTYDGKRASYIYADQETAEFEAQQVGGTARAVAVYLAAAPKEQPHE